MRRISQLISVAVLATALSGCGTVDIASAGKWSIHVAEEVCRHVIRDELREIEEADEEPPVEPTSGGEE